MTHHDLAELLREHVSSDEPPAPLPHAALTSGRRRLRARRRAGAGSAVALLAIATALVVPRLGGDDSRPDSALDPATVAALQDYDVHQMPQLMDEHVRRVLVTSVPDLGPSRFTALDATGQPLDEAFWDKASLLSVKFGSDGHRYAATITHSKAEAEGDPDRYCRSGLDEGLYLECAVERTDVGDVVINLLWALKPMEAGNTLGGVAHRDELDDVPLDELTFERVVKVIRSETLITYVSEEVQATDRDPATAAFVTPVDDLVTIAMDPELVMPVPPTGDNGCPAWILPDEDGGVDASCGPSRAS